MSNYSIQTTNPTWSEKDVLNTGATGKTIKAAELSAEFLAIVDAIEDKAEVSGASSEPFATSTAESSSNTTLAASTEYVTSALVEHTPASDSNGYGTRYVQSADPANDSGVTLVDGDVWYET